MLRKYLLFFQLISLSLSNLEATPLRSPKEVKETALSLKKEADTRNMEDFQELQQAIRRVLARKGETLLQNLSLERGSLLKKISDDQDAIRSATLKPELMESFKLKELRYSLLALDKAKELIEKKLHKERKGSSLFSKTYAQELIRSQTTDITASKLALVYILDKISEEALLNIKALKLTHGIAIKNPKSQELLKETSFYNPLSKIFYLPNSGFSLEKIPSYQNFRGTNGPGFAALCFQIEGQQLDIKNFIAAWEILKTQPRRGDFPTLLLASRLTALNGPRSAEELNPGDLIVTKRNVMIIEEKPSNLKNILVIYSTRSLKSLKEGIVAKTIALPEEDYWVLRPRG